jgi:hypothetical protein
MPCDPHWWRSAHADLGLFGFRFAQLLRDHPTSAEALDAFESNLNKIVKQFVRDISLGNRTPVLLLCFDPLLTVHPSYMPTYISHPRRMEITEVRDRKVYVF